MIDRLIDLSLKSIDLETWKSVGYDDETRKNNTGRARSIKPNKPKTRRLGLCFDDPAQTKAVEIWELKFTFDTLKLNNILTYYLGCDFLLYFHKLKSAE